MADAKNKTAKKRDPLPERFATIEEAAEFWDTHDSADYEEYMRDVECQVNI
ncbi:MAG: CopG antitoxin of type toxin-antitoxin system, partial [Pyrinomonadaceae bacterium]|nr:CopG antitoxin of type toxin-antitoxin system [Pyrinomonadaceae bacterium]